LKNSSREDKVGDRCEKIAVTLQSSAALHGNIVINAQLSLGARLYAAW